MSMKGSLWRSAACVWSPVAVAIVPLRTPFRPAPWHLAFCAHLASVLCVCLLLTSPPGIVPPQHPCTQLRSDVLPRTVENFLRLVTGDMSRDTPEELCYRTTVFHTVLPGQMVVGGDILVSAGGWAHICVAIRIVVRLRQGNDGTGQPVSIYGGTFEDEGFPVKVCHHVRREPLLRSYPGANARNPA